jgi:hypothetical protein
LRLSIFLASISLLSCASPLAWLQPSATVHLAKASVGYENEPIDTTDTIFILRSKINLDFNLNGSNRISVGPGFSRLIASGISSGWYYMDIIGTTMWVRGLPVYLIGGDSVSIDVDNNYLSVDGYEFFVASQERSTDLPFMPSLSISCLGCTVTPQIKLDDQPVHYVPPWIEVDPGWHTIEIDSFADNVRLYYRTLFDNYSITRFIVYPVEMN